MFRTTNTWREGAGGVGVLMYLIDKLRMGGVQERGEESQATLALQAVC